MDVEIETRSQPMGGAVTKDQTRHSPSPDREHVTQPSDEAKAAVAANHALPGVNGLQSPPAEAEAPIKPASPPPPIAAPPKNITAHDTAATANTAATPVAPAASAITLTPATAPVAPATSEAQSQPEQPAVQKPAGAPAPLSQILAPDPPPSRDTPDHHPYKRDFQPAPPATEADATTNLPPPPLPPQPLPSLPPVSELAPPLATGSIPPAQPLPAREEPAIAEPPAPAPAIAPLPTSNLRDILEPVSSDARAGELMAQKHQTAVAADHELANGLARSDEAPIARNVATPPPVSSPPAPQPATVAEGDAMDTSDARNLPMHPSPAPAPPLAEAAAPPPLPLPPTVDSPPQLDAPAEPPVPPSAPSAAGATPSGDVLPPPPEPAADAPTPAASSKLALPDADQAMLDAPPPASTKVSRSREDEGADEEPATKRTRTDDGTDPADFKMPDAPASAASAPAPDGNASAPSQTEDASQTAGPGSLAGAAGAPAAERAERSDGKLAPPDPRPPRPDWDSEITVPRQRALARGLSSLRKSNPSKPFAAPVDPVALNLPTYFETVRRPMDLKTLEANLKANRYPTVAEFVADFDQIVANTTLFNGPDHTVSQDGYKMWNSFEKHLQGLPGLDEKEPEKKKKAVAVPKPPSQRRESRSSIGVAAPAAVPAGIAAAAPAASTPRTPAAASPTQTFAVGPSGVPQIRRDSTVADGRPKREVHPPASRDLLYAKPIKKKYAAELRFCADLLDEFAQPRYHDWTQYFDAPVDPVALNIPNYLKIIKRPMDLGTMRSKLRTGQYEHAREFESDMRLVFSNCQRFNTPGDVVHQAGKALEELFELRWGKKESWLKAQASSPGGQSQNTSDDEEEGDDEEGDEEQDEEGEDDEAGGLNDAESIAKIQRDMAMMQQRLADIQNKSRKKSSPTAPGAPKRRKSKIAGKGEGKEGKKDKATKKAGGKADKKDGGGKRGGKKDKEKKVPYVTYEQKQDISTRINSLPEARMAQALKIIRDNMPALAGQHEDELELDIDQVPNECLYQLLQFVRRYAPAPADPPTATGRAPGGGGGAGGAHGGGGMGSGVGARVDPRRASEGAAGHVRPKKNKPMSSTVQEAKIREIRGRLNQMQTGGAGGHPSASASSPEGGTADTSGDEDSEESEED